MTTSYKVTIRKTDVYEGKRGNTYYVRWSVEARPFKEPFKSSALARSFKAGLVRAVSKGEAFDTATGLPTSIKRATDDMPWYDFACAYVDMKWPGSAATTRRTVAEAMTAITTSMLTDNRGKPDDKAIRHALTRWAFNTGVRANAPTEVRRVLTWIARHTRNVSALAEPDLTQLVLDNLKRCLDGTPARPSVTGRRRRILNTACEYAVKRKLLPHNPLPAVKDAAAPRAVQTVDRRSVANPVQARTLLEAVRVQARSGPRLTAYFGCLYFAALRPEEAASLRKHNLAIPEEGWGELHLEGAEPHAGKDWTDSGKTRDKRQLKQRQVGESRTVPCPPELTALLHQHIGQFGTSPDGLLFRGERNGEELPRNTINKAWRRARAAVFTPEVQASPLAATPYDLRHAAVSTWLNAGIPAADVAEWAGHSVEVLLKIYAKCLDGGKHLLRQRIQRALGHGPAV